MFPNINYAKVKSIYATPYSPTGFEATVYYCSGSIRHFAFDETEPALGQFIAACKANHVFLGGLCEGCSLRFPVTSIMAKGEPMAVCQYCAKSAKLPPAPDALALILGLPSTHFKGANRLNFWYDRNSVLHIQVERPKQPATKLKLPDAVISRAGLVEFFAGWGWDQVNGNLYFKANGNALVRI